MENEIAEDNVFTATEGSSLGAKELLVVTEGAKECLLSTTKWVKFLAILGSIGIGFCLIGGLVVTAGLGATATTLNQFYGAGMSVGLGMIYIIIALVMIYPILKMFKFCSKIRAALLSNDEITLFEGLQELRRFFKFYGWIAALYLIFFAVMILIGILGAAVSTL